MSSSDGPEYDDGASPEFDPEALGDAGAAMDPDHPLLARAQAALKKQLLETQRDLEERIREKSEELDVRPSPALVVPVPSPLARPETPTSGLGAPASSPRARVRPGARTRLSSGASRDATPGPEPTRGFPEAHRDSHRTVSPPPPLPQPHD